MADEGVGLERRRHGRREPVPVHRQRAAGGHLMGVALGHDEGAEAAHLLVQQAHRVGLRVVRAEGVGADELGKPVRLVGVGAAQGAHLVEDHRNAGLRDLPGRLRTGKPAADHMDGFDCAHAHSPEWVLLTPRGALVKLGRSTGKKAMTPCNPGDRSSL
jgi:hypothetical protein